MNNGGVKGRNVGGLLGDKLRHHYVVCLIEGRNVRRIHCYHMGEYRGNVQGEGRMNRRWGVILSGPLVVGVGGEG